MGSVALAAEKCPLCGMSIAGNENTAFVIIMKTGEDVTYCCAHCGLWVMATDKALKNQLKNGQ